MLPKMYGLSRLRSARNLRSLITAAAGTSSPRHLLRLSTPIRPFAFPQFSSRSLVDHPPPVGIDDSVKFGGNERPLAAGTDDFVKIGENERAAARIDDFVMVGENESDGDDTYERKVLPPELLSGNVAMLTCKSDVEGGICRVYLVGTCHVSEESRKEVEDIVKFLKPQVVFLELCSSRKAALKLKKLKELTMGEIVHLLLKKQSPLGILYAWHLAKVARELGVVPGAEFRAAYEEAKKYGGTVVLGDRSVQITLQRITSKMTLRNITKFIYDGLFTKDSWPEDLADKLKRINYADIPNHLMGMNDVDLVDLNETMSKVFPSLMGPLVHERDQYMSAKLLEVARKHQSVVAVVGKGHLPGIQKNWEQPVDLEQLFEVPAKKKTFTMRMLGSVGATVSSMYHAIKK